MNPPRDIAQQVALLELQLDETMRQLELALEDRGWRELGIGSDRELSRAAIQRIAEFARAAAIKNPLIKRAVRVQSYYVFGQGITVHAADERVNDLVQAFWLDDRTQSVLTGHQALAQRNRDLQVEGNVFVVLFTEPLNGKVRVRTLQPDEVAEIVTDPDDAAVVWYYVRRLANQGKRAYPDYRYTPRTRPDEYNGIPIAWDAPVYHIAVDRVGRWGVPELYAALDWSGAYKLFLEDWATITRALSRFAAKLKTPGGRGAVQAAQTLLGTTLGNGGSGEETNPAPLTGSIFTAGPGYDYEPIKIAGANVSAEDGRRLLLMVASAVGLPETFFGDASVGSLATAESLDRPTELQMLDRQQLWRDALTDILDYVIAQAALAPQGPLRSLVRRVVRTRDPITDEIETVIEWIEEPPPNGGEPQAVDTSVEISFPPVVVRDEATHLGAIERAAKLLPGYDGQRLIARLVLEVLGVNEIDALLDRILPPELAEAQQAGGGGDPVGSDTLGFARRVNAATALIRAGFAPADALIAVGLDPIAHLGFLPATLQRPEPEGEPANGQPANGQPTP